nr:MAG: glycoprotein [Wufeng shrew chuvirus 6]
MILLTVLLPLLWASPGLTLVGYDCEKPESNISTIALSMVAKCDALVKIPEPVPVNVMVLQTIDNHIIKGVSCLIERSYLIFHCGMHSHTSVTRDGFMTNEILGLSEDACRKLHLTGEYVTDTGYKLSGIKVNSLDHRDVDEQGSVWGSIGDCSGKDFSLNGRDYKSAIMQSDYKILLKTINLQLSTSDTAKVHLPGGATADYVLGHTFDEVYGYIFWKPEQLNHRCSHWSHAVLYEGMAMRYNSDVTTSTIVANNTLVTFALQLKKQQIICDVHGYTTDHPRLNIIIVNSNMLLPKLPALSPTQVDMFLYTNAKFVFFQHHFKGQLNDMFFGLHQRLCDIKYQLLIQLTTLAYISPEEFAWAYTQSPGITAVMAGEVLYLIKCTPVPITIRNTNECYNEIPVLYNNQTRFMKPRSHIISDFGSEKECNPLSEPLYFLEGKWVQLKPTPHAVENPLTLTATEKSIWSYKDIPNLLSSGLYSDTDLVDFRKSLLFPTEQKAIVHTIASKTSGHNVGSQQLSLGSLLSVDDIHSLHQSYFKLVYGYFSEFGQFTAGVGGFVLIAMLIKSLINALINGTLLYKTFGCSFKLLSVVWGTVAKHFLYLASKTSRVPPTTGRSTKHPAKNSSAEMMSMLTVSTQDTVGPNPPATNPNVIEESVLTPDRFKTVYPRC